MAKEYIERNSLWKALDVAHLFDNGNPRHIAQQVVEEQPVADVVEVVRCKDCVFNVANMRKDPLDATDYSDITCSYFMTDGITANDFCSYGKKVE